METSWDQMTIPATLRRAAEQWPDVAAVEEAGTTRTFAELAADAEAAARAFLAVGIEPGDRVAIWAPNGLRWQVAALGLQSVGAILAAVNLRFKAGETADVLRRSGVRRLLTISDHEGTDLAAAIAGEDLPDLEGIVTLEGESANAQSWEAFLASGADVRAERAGERADAVKPDDISDFIFTSGTTGKPKAVMTAHGQNLEVFHTWSEGVGLRPADRYLIVGPYSHSFGYKAGWLACLITGATALPHRDFDVPAVMERIQRDRINVLPGAPSLYQAILAHPERGSFDTSSLRLAVTGAAPVPVELVKRMWDDLGFETVLTAYGLTESCGTVSMCLTDDDAETISTTAGRPLPRTEVKCVDSAGDEVARGEPGEIWVRGYNVMRGYFGNEEETAKAIDDDGWLHTGDIGVMDARGYLQITDRIKDMFIMNGFNVYPAEVESLLFEHAGVAQAAVIGVPDARVGEAGMAFVLPVAGQQLDAAEVRAWSREHMADYKVPKYVEVVDALPANASGKVLKYVLRERAEEILGS